MKKFIVQLLVVFYAMNLNAQSAYSKMKHYFSTNAKEDLKSGNNSKVWQFGAGGKFSKLNNNYYIELSPTIYYNTSFNAEGTFAYENKFDLIQLSEDLYLYKQDKDINYQRIIYLYNYALFEIEVQTSALPYEFKLKRMYMCGTDKKYGNEREFVGGYGIEWEAKNQAFEKGGTYFNGGQFENQTFTSMINTQKTIIQNILKGAKDNKKAAEAKIRQDMMDATSANAKKISEENAQKRIALIEKFGDAKLFKSEYVKWNENGNPQLTAFYTNSVYYAAYANLIKSTKGYLNGSFDDNYGTVIYQGTGLESRIVSLENKTMGYEYISIKNFGEFDKADNWDSHTNLSKFKQSYYWIYNGNNKTKINDENPIGALFWIKGNLIHYNTADQRTKIFNVWSFPGAATLQLKQPSDFFELSDYFKLVVLAAQKNVALK